MKTRFYTKTLIALAVAVAAAAASVSPAQEQPIPPPGMNTLPPNILPGTPLADVIKMLRAGVDPSTIRSYIANAQSAFNLDADKIIGLKDEGAPSDLINAMMDRDKVLYASTIMPPQPQQPATTVVEGARDTAAPTAEVTVNYFNDNLSPYGTWLDVDGYGRCWRPTAVIYDSSWRPYCDRGHWVYTDCGWYWDSDYSWGVAFHYGRWFRHPHFGWCWFPDTVWAPSWVTWRASDEACGWAPLPPFAVFRPGAGFFYRGVSVGVDFDFGLGADYFTFVAPGHFCDRQPRNFVLAQMQAAAAFQRAAMINNFAILKNQMYANLGIEVARMRAAAHQNIQPISVSSLPNAGRQGWRGGNNTAVGTGLQLRHGPELRKADNNSGNAILHGNSGQGMQGSKSSGDGVQPFRGSALHNEVNPETALRHESSGPIGQNTKSSVSQFGLANSQTQFHSQSGGTVASQNNLHEFSAAPTSQTDSHPFNTFSPGNSKPSLGDWRQNRDLVSPVEAVPQHGAAQLQQRQFITPVQPHVQTFSDSAPRSSAPVAPVTSGSHSSAGTASSGSSSGPARDKQNH